MADLFLIASLLFMVVMVIRVLVHLLKRRNKMAAKVALIAALYAGAYLAVMVIVSLSSPTTKLATGADKCFDEWCVGLVGAQPDSSGYSLTMRTSNHGRRAQRPDTPELFVVSDGNWSRVDDDFLQSRLSGGQTTEQDVHVDVPKSAKSVQLLAIEGGFPTQLVIGDENSLMHPKAFWQLRP